MKYLILFLLIIISGCAPLDYSNSPYPVIPASASQAFCKTQPQILTGPQPDFTQNYTIKAGDNLWQLARRFDISSESIMRLNGIDSSTGLTVGQKIIIPQTQKISQNNRFSWPTKGKIIDFYDEKIDNIPNSGLNIKTAVNDVLASADGKVIFCDYLNGWGKTLILKHTSNFYTIYANLASSAVKEGDYVVQKTIIGNMDLGDGKNRILHFEIRKQYHPQNPLKYLE